MRRLVVGLVAAFALGSVAVPVAAQPVSACRHIPPVHHRMHGHSGPTREGDGLENTIAGMWDTYRTGVRWFETDLRQLENRRGVRGAGRMVLFHDWLMDRTTNRTGPIQRLNYRQIPSTTAGEPIPTLGEAFKWLAAHPGTHLLVEVKMMLRWSKVVHLLKRYGFDGTRRVMFDAARGEKRMPRHDVAVAMQDRLEPYVVTGLKQWDPERRPASYLSRFGSEVRLGLEQGIQHRAELDEAGVSTRFLKVINGTAGELVRVWRRAVKSGAFTAVITEDSAEYLGWCDRVSGHVDGGGPRS